MSKIVAYISLVCWQLVGSGKQVRGTTYTAAQRGVAVGVNEK